MAGNKKKADAMGRAAPLIGAGLVSHRPIAMYGKSGAEKKRSIERFLVCPEGGHGVRFTAFRDKGRKIFRFPSLSVRAPPAKA
jgi:hypothetical protein